jgi:chromosome segregation ATPase
VVDPAAEALAAELAWAASGAALEIESLRARVATLQRACDERGDVIAELQSHLEILRRAAADRADVIVMLDEALAREREQSSDARARLAAERDGALQSLEAALRARHENEARELESLRARLRGLQDTALTRGELIVELQRTCEERMALIERLSAEAERRSVLLADMTAAFEASVRELESLRAGASRPF